MKQHFHINWEQYKKLSIYFLDNFLIISVKLKILYTIQTKEYLFMSIELYQSDTFLVLENIFIMKITAKIAITRISSNFLINLV